MTSTFHNRSPSPSIARSGRVRTGSTSMALTILIRSGPVALGHFQPGPIPLLRHSVCRPLSHTQPGTLSDDSWCITSDPLTISHCNMSATLQAALYLVYTLQAFRCRSHESDSRHPRFERIVTDSQASMSTSILELSMQAACLKSTPTSSVLTVLTSQSGDNLDG